MAPAPTRTNPPLDPAQRRKFRFRFRKQGDLRLVSHHDLMHCFARMLRRAEIPVAHTQGFHPQPRLVFALSLALGIVGCREVVELELTQPLEAEDVLGRLRACAPGGLEFLSAAAVALNTTAQVRRVRYALPVPADRREPLGLRVAELSAEESRWIERRRPQPRRLNLRTFLQDVRMVGNELEATLWMASNGTIRPEELLTELQANDLLDAGCVLERRDLELVDEITPDAEPMPPLERFQAAAQPLQPTEDSRYPDRSPPKPTSLVAGPLSFDS